MTINLNSRIEVLKVAAVCCSSPRAAMASYAWPAPSRQVTR